MLAAAALLLGALVLTLAGCSGDDPLPTEPPGPDSVTGTWSGQITGVRWQGGPERDGTLRMTLRETSSPTGLEVLDGTFAVTFPEGDRLTGSIGGAVTHEWYLGWDAERGCTSQMRGQQAGDRITGEWFGWNCDAGAGTFEVQRE